MNSILAFPGTNSAKYFEIVSAGDGDSDRIRVSGMSHLGRKNGRIQLARIGPFIPPMSVISFNGIVVTQEMLTTLSNSPFRDWKKKSVIKAHIVRSDWSEPNDSDEWGEPEDVILDFPHDAEVADTLGDLWELLLPIGCTVDSVEHTDAMWTSAIYHCSKCLGGDLFRAKHPGGYSYLCSSAFREWITAIPNVARWLQFHDVEIKLQSRVPRSKGRKTALVDDAVVNRFRGTKAGEDRELVPEIVFRWCPSGSFVMGSPESEVGRDDECEGQVDVKLTSGFWMGETPVTQGQWKKLMGTAPWKNQLLIKEGYDYPATHISYDDAVSFCQKLTCQEHEAERLPKIWRVALPTEAQWEYACRADSKTRYCFGDDEGQLGEFGWFYNNAYDIGEEYAHRVGQKKANAWGLRDMHGNISEWCGDYSEDKLSGGVDPRGPSSGSFRICRGGAFYHGFGSMSVGHSRTRRSG